MKSFIPILYYAQKKQHYFIKYNVSYTQKNCIFLHMLMFFFFFVPLVHFLWSLSYSQQWLLIDGGINIPLSQME